MVANSICSQQGGVYERRSIQFSQAAGSRIYTEIPFASNLRVDHWTTLHPDLAAVAAVGSTGRAGSEWEHHAGYNLEQIAKSISRYSFIAGDGQCDADNSSWRHCQVRR